MHSYISLLLLGPAHSTWLYSISRSSGSGASAQQQPLSLFCNCCVLCALQRPMEHSETTSKGSAPEWKCFYGLKKKKTTRTKHLPYSATLHCKSSFPLPQPQLDSPCFLLPGWMRAGPTWAQCCSIQLKHNERHCCPPSLPPWYFQQLQPLAQWLQSGRLLGWLFAEQMGCSSPTFALCWAADGSQREQEGTRCCASGKKLFQQQSAARA